MNPCVPVLVAALVLAGAPLQAQRRPFPATALRGELVIGQAPEVTLNGRPARLAPGAVIRAQDNMMVMWNTVAGTRLTVNYTMDSMGLVKDVWVLTRDEAVRRWPRSPEESSRLSFDPMAQAWVRR